MCPHSGPYAGFVGVRLLRGKTGGFIERQSGIPKDGDDPETSHVVVLTKDRSNLGRGTRRVFKKFEL